MTTPYTGWDRWIYPIELEGFDVTVKEPLDGSTATETFTFDGTFYATKETHGSTLPGESFYQQLIDRMNSSSLTNSYTLTRHTIAAHEPGTSTIDIARFGSGERFEMSVQDGPEALLGWQQGTTTRQDASGVIAGTVSMLGALQLSADRSPEQRGWPMRRAGLSRPDTVHGRIRENAQWRRRDIRYRRLASVDVHPSRVRDTTDNPLYSTADFDDSAFFASALDDQNNQLRQLFNRARRLEEVIVVWGDGDSFLDVTDKTWERGVCQWPDRWEDVWRDWPGGERYQAGWALDVTGGTREH